MDECCFTAYTYSFEGTAVRLHPKEAALCAETWLSITQVDSSEESIAL